MTMRVASNIGHNPNRKLPLIYGSSDKAIGTDTPAVAAAALKRKLLGVSMGIAGPSGQVTVAHDNGAQRTITLWVFNPAANEWFWGGPVAGVYTQTVDNKALATFSAPPGAHIYFQASATADNFYIGGAIADENNPSKDQAS